jgi:hypothetical protein
MQRELQKDRGWSRILSRTEEPILQLRSPMIAHQSAIGLWTITSMIELPPQLEYWKPHCITKMPMVT